MIKFTCTKDLCRIILEKIIADTKKTLSSHNLIEKYKLGKFLSCTLSIVIDDAGLEKKKNQFINGISDFNNKHII